MEFLSYAVAHSGTWHKILDLLVTNFAGGKNENPYKSSEIDVRKSFIYLMLETDTIFFK